MDCGDWVAGWLHITVRLSVIQCGDGVAACHSVSVIQGEDGELWGRGGRVAVCHSVSLIQGEDGGLWGRGGRVAVPHAGEARVEAPSSAGRGLAAQQAEGPL